jgi:hypothetical protein
MESMSPSPSNDNIRDINDIYFQPSKHTYSNIEITIFNKMTEIPEVKYMITFQ